jgi:superfamily I DNA/RNA helicase
MNQPIQWETTIPKFPFDENRVWKIAASAGCGKTYQISQAINDLIDSGVDADKIMYIIFNKKPADEFVDELRLKGIDHPKWMGTHHSLCRKLLGVKKILEKKALQEWGAERGMAFSEDGKGGTEWDNVFSTLSVKIYDKNPNLDPMEQKLLGMLKEEEAQNRQYTFVRIIEIATSMGLMPGGIEYVFIDEAQDNGAIQYDYFNHIKSLDYIKGIMLVGDDKQAINGFKGGRWDLFMDWEAERHVCLGKTYRCAKNILNYANNIAEPILKRSPLTEETDKTEPGSIIHCRFLEDAIPEIREDLKKKKQIYILLRAGKKYKLPEIHSILNHYNVPAQSVIKDRILKTFFAMRALAQKQSFSKDDIKSIVPLSDPKDGELKKTAYWKSNILNKFLSGDYDIDKEPDKYVENAFLLSGQEADLETLGFHPKFMEDVKATLNNKLPRGVWKRVDNSFIDSLEQQINLYGLDMGSVCVSTIHSIKGGEADVVILLKNIFFIQNSFLYLYRNKIINH